MMLHREIFWLLGNVRLVDVGAVLRQCWVQSDAGWVAGHTVERATWWWPWGAVGGHWCCHNQ